MAIASVNTIVSYSPVKSVALEAEAVATRHVVSRSSFTAADGSTVTTILYSDGTTETQTTPGDSVELSPLAQKLVA